MCHSRRRARLKNCRQTPLCAPSEAEGCAEQYHLIFPQCGSQARQTDSPHSLKINTPRLLKPCDSMCYPPYTKTFLYLREKLWGTVRKRSFIPLMANVCKLSLKTEWAWTYIMFPTPTPSAEKSNQICTTASKKITAVKHQNRRMLHIITFPPHACRIRLSCKAEAIENSIFKEHAQRHLSFFLLVGSYLF